jgi:hypothetical protein
MSVLDVTRFVANTSLPDSSATALKSPLAVLPPSEASAMA